MLISAIILLLGCITWLLPGLVAPLANLVSPALERLLGPPRSLIALDGVRRISVRSASWQTLCITRSKSSAAML